MMEAKVYKGGKLQHVDLRKSENFVKSKCYPENVSKDKREKVNFRKSL